MNQSHPFPPIYNARSTCLILGSFPSIKSREEGFFYGHPQNRFWKVLAAVFDSPLPTTVEEKRAFLLGHNIALWDVIASCSVENSADSSIKDVAANDLSSLLKHSAITKIFTNGRTAQKLYEAYQAPVIGIKARYLPSTSPANAAQTLEKLIAAWQVIRS